MQSYENRNINSLKNNPSLLFIIGFAAIIFFGATLLNLPFASVDGNSIGFIDSLFTASSAVCVTGLAVVNTAEHWTLFGKIVIMLLIQVGGLGIMTMSTLISFFLGKKISLKARLLIKEERNTDALQGVVKLTKYMIMSTVIIELIGAILLSTVFIKDFGPLKGIWYSVFHSVSAFCNAGFDLLGDSMVRYVSNPTINIAVSFLVISGGIGFFVLWEIFEHKKFKKFSLHSKLVLVITASLLAFGFFIIFAFEYNNPDTLGNLSFFGKIQAAFFQSMTARTAGFNSVDIASLRIPTVLIFMVLMFIGGSSGSTAGGVKTTTAGVLFITMYNTVLGKRDVEIYMKRISYSLIIKAMTIVGIAFAVVIIVCLILTITEASSGFEFIDIMFETISAFGTVGVSRGLTPFLSEIGRVIISLTMFIGRLGPLTIAVAIATKPKNTGNYTYPEGKIIVG